MAAATLRPQMTAATEHGVWNLPEEGEDQALPYEDEEDEDNGLAQSLAVTTQASSSAEQEWHRVFQLVGDAKIYWKKDFPDPAAEIAAEQLVRCYDRKLRPFATCSSILLTEVVSETCSIQNCLRRKFCVGLYPKQKALS